DPAQTASFRVYTIGIVTHGGIQDPSWIHGPPWELETAYMMRREGFDSVIGYNWVLQSSTPGAAIKQSPRLARMILDIASNFPASDPVDLEFIGHSEGTVVNTYAIVKLEGKMTPQLKSGYIEDILLDPHAANNNVPGQQMSFGGALGGLARAIVTNYQAESKDPPAFIPAVVDEAIVFFEHTQSTAGGIYNLWGQVPVKSDGPVVHYYNLTDMGVTHSGKTGVNYWFRDFIAPTLGNQAPLVQELQLNGQIDNAAPPTTASVSQSTLVQQANNARANRVYGPEQVVQSNQPEFSGTAAPGSIIRLALSPAAKPMIITLEGVTTANSTGQWSLTTGHPLRNGQYRTLVTAFSRTLTTRPGLAIVPTQPLGRLVVD
ncbi:MAG TPA: Ig-like domain-containing protein, partial [Candidatus Methylomirabilis sp.]|nr:Ig-like domain-containing protein [Candidatus Methylomirabilis sp.]